MIYWTYALIGYLINLSLRIAAFYNPKAKQLIEGRSRTIDTLRRTLRKGSPRIWFHAASLGEFEQGRPIIETLREQHPDWQIILSFYSPSGYEVRKDYQAVDAVVYLLGDTPNETRHFLDELQPNKAIFIKYDFWGIHLLELQRRQIPTYLVSAIFRPKQLFFYPWGSIYRKLLYTFTNLFVQDLESVQLLDSIGIKNAILTGDTRFDRVYDIAKKAHQIPAIELLKSDSNFVIVAGSTWQEDEEYLLDYITQKKTIKLVIAPHELNRLESIESKAINTARLSEIESGYKSINNVQVLIIDCFGLLSSLYRYADIAYIGGGFGKGIHNTLEAAVYGLPVVFGPNYQKFREAHLLLECGGGFAVTNKENLHKCLDLLTNDDTVRTKASTYSRQLVESELGATEKIIGKIF